MKTAAGLDRPVPAGTPPIESATVLYRQRNTCGGVKNAVASVLTDPKYVRIVRPRTRRDEMRRGEAAMRPVRPFAGLCGGQPALGVRGSAA